jgi:hypothetical protein
LSAEYAKRRDQVLPNPSEQSYRKIAWRPSVLHGIPAAQTRGIDAMLEGHAICDLKAERFVSFELLATAERWGGNAYNGRLDERDFGPAPVGFVLQLGGDSAAERLPPMFFKSYGWK